MQFLPLSEQLTRISQCLLQASFSQKSQTQQTDDLDGTQTFHFAGVVILVIFAPGDMRQLRWSPQPMMPLPGPASLSLVRWEHLYGL